MHLYLHSWVLQAIRPSTHRHTDKERLDAHPIHVLGACNAIHINLMANLASDLHLCVGVAPLREQSATLTHPIVSIVAP